MKREGVYKVGDGVMQRHTGSEEDEAVQKPWRKAGLLNTQLWRGYRIGGG